MLQEANQGLPVGPHAIFGLDAAGICTHSTGPALVHLGLRPGELVGTNLFVLYRDDPINVAALRRVLDGDTFSLEREFEGRLLSTYFEPVRDRDGTVTGGLGVTTDLTEQRRVEGQLRAARERATLLADVSAALSREFLDPRALLRTAVRAVTAPVADVGCIWVRRPGETALSPGGLWRTDGGPEQAVEVPLPDPDGRPGRLAVAAVDAAVGPRPIDLDGALHPGFVAEARRCGARSGLRVPLRSRGLLLGAVDLARGEARGELTEDETGLVVEVAERCGLALDIALLLRSEQESREQLVKFQALADASDNLIGISDEQGHLVYSNPTVREYGVATVRDDVWATAAGYLGESTTHGIRSALETAGRWSGDVTVHLAGQELTGHLDAFRIAHPDTGESLGAAWIAQDVTELLATGAALRAANADLEQFKALVEASPDFIAMAGLDGTVTYVNPGGRKLVGMPADVDVTTTTIADYLTPEGLEASVTVEQPAVLARGHWEGESTLRRHDGPPVPVAIASFLMHDADTGEPYALATVQRDISERLAAENALRELANQRQALLTRLVDAQDDERTAIAADVHDDPVQALAAVDLRLGLLRRLLREQAPQLIEVLEPLQASVSGAIDRLRALLFDLEPPDLQHGLSHALRRAAEEIFEQTGTRWDVDGDQEPDVPDSTRAIAYRIAKEAMHNTRKHASARQVIVTVAGRDGGLEVTVTDDGVGLGPDPVRGSPGHRGLLNMQDRAAVAGGWCSCRNRDGGGTLTTVWLPGTALP
jgi:PAS domain S-box-containing protein